MNHYHGHQQALIKKDICIASLSFAKHSRRIFKKTFKQFDYDFVVDTCSVSDNLEQDPLIGAYWNGSQFLWCPYPSWSYNKETKSLQAPVEYPQTVLDPENERFAWDESNLQWIIEKRIDGSVSSNCCPD
jgi:hypothetical protein